MKRMRSRYGCLVEWEQEQRPSDNDGVFEHDAILSFGERIGSREYYLDSE